VPVRGGRRRAAGGRRSTRTYPTTLAHCECTTSHKLVESAKGPKSATSPETIAELTVKKRDGKDTPRRVHRSRPVREGEKRRKGREPEEGEEE